MWKRKRLKQGKEERNEEEREGELIVEITVAIVLENDKIAMVRKSLLIDIATLQPTKESN